MRLARSAAAAIFDWTKMRLSWRNMGGVMIEKRLELPPLSHMHIETFKIFCDHIDSMAPIAEFMS